VHDDRVLVEKRIERELWQRVLPHMHRAHSTLTVEAWHAPGEPVAYEVAAAQTYEPFAVGAQWGKPWGTTWFRLSGHIPQDWSGTELEAVIDLGFGTANAGFQAEGLVWMNGEPWQGVHPRRTAVPLAHLAPGPFTMLVEAAANPMLGAAYQPSPFGSLDTAGDRLLYRLRRADLAVRDDEVYGLCLDVEVLMGVLHGLPVDDPRRQRLLRQLERAFNLIDVDHVAATAPMARTALRPALDQPARASSLRVIGVGHAHIDTAWLWPIRETVRKCARTFASAVRLMDDAPEYRFVCSQAAQYAWMEEHYPPLFAKIAAKVASGQFVPVGGMWVEADMNLPSGESLIRQLVHGQRYFESRFGLRCREVWIPDVFGYPATMPQIYAAAGCDRFITQKLSWNKQNRFPHNTFWWEGLDGTRVLTHFPPVDTYNAEVTGEQMVFSERNFREHGWSDWALMPYGHGNGGGGPTREMVERAKRMTDLDGAPRLTLGTPGEFFEHVEAEVAHGAPVPAWSGELYFEMHRGTLTSQIKTKVGNRQCERLLREAELWWAAGGPLPVGVAEELHELWNEVLVQQFHDILPGSSIAWVHDEAERTHAHVAMRLEQSIACAFARLQAPAVAANAATHARREIVASNNTPAGDGPQQQLSSGQTAFALDIPGSGMAALIAQPIDDRIVTTEHSMANGYLAVQWDLDGTITSIIDVMRARELLPFGRKIALELAPDHPVEYDAWDLESWTPGLGSPIADEATVEWVERGPLLSRLRVRRSVDSSTIETTITMRAGSARLDLGFDIDWHHSEQLLSLMVPLDIHASDAACDIQFGHVRRPTHPSSPWDAAKFEVCAHRFVDVSEPAFGVAVLNDGRYGHCLFDGGVRVSLLRAARYPDPDADQGRHAVTISVLPHGAGLHEVLHEAEALNVPIRFVPGATDATDRNAGSATPGAVTPQAATLSATPGAVVPLAATVQDEATLERLTVPAAAAVPGGATPTVRIPGAIPAPVVTVDHSGVQLSAVKRADDDSGDLIVRLYEACGDRSRIAIRAATPLRAAARCNALEEPVETIDVADGFVAISVRPFELVTLRLTT
jgi:alpha-mannosidase